jgi:hypothetical protein
VHQQQHLICVWVFAPLFSEPGHNQLRERERERERQREILGNISLSKSFPFLWGGLRLTSSTSVIIWNALNSHQAEVTSTHTYGICSEVTCSELISWGPYRFLSHISSSFSSLLITIDTVIYSACCSQIWRMTSSNRKCFLNPIRRQEPPRRGSAFTKQHWETRKNPIIIIYTSYSHNTLTLSPLLLLLLLLLLCQVFTQSNTDVYIRVLRLPSCCFIFTHFIAEI